ncbi:hypothetical protein CONLIGDRAFT_666516 [Coniochaeta ligniaria NRRL 30616]|uniref:nitric-oxide synthase (NADPH) n=1 Tax=Coniochaeta ligniaria NRRL 30616 TaxID=1408157 RepID=A0A1J7J0B1_9PEZI|nr:hypothetical protein CONLIGDRAFT_666516 [Coniochaeta ligniaria NRRL 30616]
MACPLSSQPQPPSAKQEFDRIKEHYPRLATTSCTTEFCQSGRLIHTTEPKVGQDRSSAEITLDAIDFLNQLRRDDIIKSDEALSSRIAKAKNEITSTSKRVQKTDNGHVSSELVGGVWQQTLEEIEHGVKLCWKHSKRCIMRSEYMSIKVVDFRQVKTSKEMGEVLLKGMKDAYRQGDIIVTAFVFAPRQQGKSGPMIWNDNLLSYAGYRQPDGTILGNPATVNLTEEIIRLGWKPPNLKTRWDILPIVTMAEDHSPKITPIPEDWFPSVQIRHPDEEHTLAFDKLGLRWTSAAALSRLGFDIGGVQYTAAPFIGYWLDAEVGVRNLADESSYNVLPSVVKALGLLPMNHKLDDLPAYEKLAHLQVAQSVLNRVVNWSYRQVKVRMMDTLTASSMYCEFDNKHLAERGFRLPADSHWLSPPQGSIVPLWHRGGAPNYQPKPMACRHTEDPVKAWERRRVAWGLTAIESSPSSLMANGRKEDLVEIAAGSSQTRLISGPNGSIVDLAPGSTHFLVRIFYCSAFTGKVLAEKLASHTQAFLDDHADLPCQVTPPVPLNLLDLDSVNDGDHLLIIASTGSGRMPMHGVCFMRKYKRDVTSSVRTTPDRLTRVSIFGYGNSSSNFYHNRVARSLQDTLVECGFIQLELYEADTAMEDPLLDQFNVWLNSIRGALLNRLPDAQLAIPSSTFVSEDDSTLALGNKIATVTMARFVSATSAHSGTLKRVTLDTGGLEYADMSHVAVHVPLEDPQIESLLIKLTLSGNEVVELSQRTFTTSRQVLALVDLDRPFVHTRWANKIGLSLSTEDMNTLQQQSLRMSFESSILSGRWSKKLTNGDSLLTFLSALPLRQAKTFSAASCCSHNNFRADTEGFLDIIVRTNPGGLFTEHFLSRARPGLPLHISLSPGPGERLVLDSRPLITFTTGSGIAPLRSLIQARLAFYCSEGSARALGQVMAFMAYRKVDDIVVSDVVLEANIVELFDGIFPSPNASGRLEDCMFESATRKTITRKIMKKEANIFVSASKDSADNFAVNLEAILGVPDIKEALGERWVEEVYSY